jgi:hypothetical protein
VHKKDALIVDQVLFNAMEERHYENSDSNACSVVERLSGKRNTTVPHEDSTGSSCGLRRVAQLNYFVNYPGTVKSSSMALKIIGLNKIPRSITITPMSGT